MTLRVGIVGFGGAGRAHHSYFSCFPECRVDKVFDTKPEGLARAAAACPELARFGELEPFLDDLDVVSVCAPDRHHARYVVAALARGCHVLCEKPLTDSLDGIRAIARAEAESGRTLAVLHQMRFVPLHQKIERLLDQGELGRVAYAEGYYVHDLTERAFAYDDWRREENATPMVYAGCHFVDLLRWFAGAEVEQVYAAGNHLQFPAYPECDLALATLHFAGGMLGKVLVSFGAAAPQDHSVRVYGSQASVDGGLLFGRGGAVRAIHAPIVVQEPLLHDPNRANRHDLLSQLRRNLPAWLLGRGFEAARLLARRPDAEYGARHYPIRLYEHALACVAAVGDFLAALRDGRPPLCTGAESARTVLACLAAVESQRSGRPEPVRRLEEVV